MSHSDFPPAGPEVSVMIPVYNEEAGLARSSNACTRPLDALATPMK